MSISAAAKEKGGLFCSLEGLWNAGPSSVTVLIKVSRFAVALLMTSFSIKDATSLSDSSDSSPSISDVSSDCSLCDVSLTDSILSSECSSIGSMSTKVMLSLR